MSITIQDLRNIAKSIKTQRVPALKVETQEQADRMTLVDPVEHKWTVGEEYYVVYAPTGACDY